MLLFILSFLIVSCGKNGENSDSSKNKYQETEVESNDVINQKDVAQEEKEVVAEEPNTRVKKEGQSQNGIEKVQPPKDEKPKIPIIFFQEKVYKFGDIDQGDTIKHSFMFINTGSAPLYITDVDLSCGCTISEYPQTAVKPRQAGYIELLFNSTHKEGSQRQYAIVSSNTIPGRDTLLLAGVVYKKLEDIQE